MAIYIPSDPAAVHELFALAVQAEDAGEKNRALELYEKIAETDPCYPPACVNAGSIAHGLGCFQLAEEQYRRAFEADPEYALAGFNLATTLEDLGRYGEALDLYQRVISIDAGFTDAYFNLARLLQKKDDREKARHYWRIFLRLRRYGKDAEEAVQQIKRLE